MSAAGKTKWFKYSDTSTRPWQVGTYECVVRRAGMPHYHLETCYWDGIGFVNQMAPWPFVVSRWRGAPKKAYTAALKGVQK